jgi:hypothetical protein
MRRYVFKLVLFIIISMNVLGLILTAGLVYKRQVPVSVAQMSGVALSGGELVSALLLANDVAWARWWLVGLYGISMVRAWWLSYPDDALSHGLTAVAVVVVTSPAKK